MALTPISGVSSGPVLSTAPRLIEDMLRAGTTLRANLGAAGNAIATAVMRYADGRVGVDMSLTGNADPTLRGHVYRALIGAAYGMDASSNPQGVSDFIASDEQLTSGNQAFRDARSGAVVSVAIPV